MHFQIKIKNLINHPNNFLDNLTLLFICLAPIGYLAFDNWLGNFYVLASLFSIIALVRTPNKTPLTADEKLFLLVFLAYPCAIFLSQAFRWEWRLYDYHNQSRFLLAIPVFLFLTRKRVDFINYLSIIIPLILILAFFSANVFFKAAQWDPDRIAPNFVDPLEFGQLSLSLGLLSFCIFLLPKFNFRSLPLLLWNFLGFVIGIYLSIKSGSRTGWLALPIVMAFVSCNKLNLSHKNSFLFILLGSTLLGVISFTLVPKIHDRIFEAYSQISNYSWAHGVHFPNSVGWRITFVRLGFYYFSHSPLVGWGEHGFTSLMSDPAILQFARPDSIQFSYNALFHNELVTQMVRYGFLGIIGYVVVFGISFKLFWKYRYLKNQEINLASYLGITYLTCQFISGLSDEVFNLKGMVSISALLLACLMASAINRFKNTQK